MNTQSHADVMDAHGIYYRTYLDGKHFYLYTFRHPPSIVWLDQVDKEKLLGYVKRQYQDSIMGVYQYAKYDRKKKKITDERTIVVLEGSCMLEMAHEYCDILYAHDSYAKAHELLKEFGKFRKKEPKTRSEIHLVTRDGDDMELKTMDIKKTKLDIGLMYDDGFAETDAIIRKRLNKKEDKGIVLLHGLPGSGKTTYIRHLVGQIRKKVLFLSAGIVRKITDPDLMDLLIENPDCVLVIEDAEHLIMDRKIKPDSSVSDLLNLSDGLLADFLHVQLICTFNSPLTMVDPALLRKGRLIAKYEFGRLPVQKAQRVSDHMGYSTVIHQPMTLAEIASQHEKDFEADRQIATIGFRR